MLLNLSNHPFAQWGDTQKQAAITRYDAVKDLPFPKIDPQWTRDEIAQLADEYELKIREINPAAVHIMGEMTFTYALVNRLIKAGFICIASTTERVVTEDGKGQKTSVFRFVQFRNY